VMRVLFLGFLVFMVINANAQVSKGWYAEAQVMSGHSWYSNERSVQKFHLYYKGGVNMIKIWEKGIGLGIGFAFSGEGGTTMYKFNNSTTKERALYTKVPVFARYQFIKKKTSPFADMGMVWGFFAGGESRNVYQDKEYVSNTSVDNEIDLGLFGHLGVKHQLSNGSNIFGFVGYNQGLSPKKHYVGGESPYITNRNIGIGMGFSTRLY